MILVLGVAVFIVMLILHRPGTRACRWRADRTRDRATLACWRCAACGAEAFTATGKPPQDCKRNAQPPSLWKGRFSMTYTPDDADARRAVRPVICYPNDSLPAPDLAAMKAARQSARKLSEVIAPARDAACFHVPAGGFFRITCVGGPQVGDLNLWNEDDLSERFYSGKTRALHGTHLTTGMRMWSNFPNLRPMATIIDDTLAWYGKDAFGGSVHDVIGTRCDPYTHKLLTDNDYHHCCHSNLTRALADEIGLPLPEAEAHVHDVLNVFMCTGFTRDTGQYFMKASPVRPGDYLEFYAEINLLGALSACPGGDCSAEHSSDSATCHPLKIEVFEGRADPAPRNGYDRSHGR